MSFDCKLWVCLKEFEHDAIRTIESYARKGNVCKGFLYCYCSFLPCLGHSLQLIPHFTSPIVMQGKTLLPNMSEHIVLRFLTKYVCHYGHSFFKAFFFDLSILKFFLLLRMKDLQTVTSLGHTSVDSLDHKMINCNPSDHETMSNPSCVGNHSYHLQIFLTYINVWTMK